jgi:hypothetical protein
MFMFTPIQRSLVNLQANRPIGWKPPSITGDTAPATRIAETLQPPWLQEIF